MINGLLLAGLLLVIVMELSGTFEGDEEE